MGMKEDTIDVMTSKLSTLPYNDDKMQKMIGLVQNAKRRCPRRIRDKVHGPCYLEAQGSVGDAGDMEYYIAATSECMLNTCLLHYLLIPVISTSPVVFL